MGQQNTKPRVVPLLSEGGPSGFLIEVRNTSARVITLELVRFIKQRDPPGRRLPNPSPRDIVGNIQIERTLSAGEHKLIVSCGGDWSDELAFYWVS